ncbi:hypothetical protein F5Y03DRAFT_399325 [Xylaria venustula]|nr:hypothetical protein F5Y03DRAFT_399325 [Xylaria venustula]
MPLGASITAGYGTFPQNGYRKPLRDQLRWRGWRVNMVGSLADGDPETFHNRQHEGHKSFVVAQMKGVANNTIPRQPNLILINCGTNDADPGNEQDIPGTAGRMEALLTYLYSQIDGVTIILSTLLERKDGYNSNVQNIINPGYRDLYQQFAAQGRKIVLAEFDDGFLDLSTDYYDNLHPNEKGAAKLAAVWDQAIQVAENKGFLTPPIDTGKPDNGTTSDTTCDVTLGAGRGPIRTQGGSGANDGPYAHDEDDFGTSEDHLTLELGPDRDIQLDLEGDHTQVFFAQLVNVGGADPPGYVDELIHCSDQTADEVAGSCVMWINTGHDFTTAPGVTLDVGLKCLTRGIRWGDVNGDGLDDFICISPQGNMYVSINQGDNPPTFKPTGDGGLIRKGESWVTQDRVRLGDMDGDGRLDYCAIDDKGDLYCWRNGGVGLAPTTAEGGYWQGLVGGAPTFYAQHEPEGIEGVHLVDINGDGRSDWVYVYNDGSTKIFTNQRGDKDDDGPGLRPHWTRATKDHPAYNYVAAKHNVHFGRIWGSGRTDRIITLLYSRDSDSSYVLLPFRNTGKGGTKLKGDGVYYCDMFGRGHDDYLWVLSTGEITLYENINSPPNWGQHGVIIDIGRDRKSIQFGDWDGDGLCDILAVERHTGRVEWWRNTYKPGDTSPTFAKPAWAVDTGSNLCTEGWGLGLYDQALKFGDLDGDKRVDYLCMMKDGQTFGSLNKAGGLQYKGQIKYAPSGHLDRANFKWADVTGDGLVDLIWVDKFTGKARVWKNGGFIPASGSSMTWLQQGTVFKGYGRGENIHFPTLGSQGRADYHDVYPGTCIANTWFNECADVGQGVDDYPVPIDPHLPTPPGLPDNGDTPPATLTVVIPQPTVTGTFTGLIEQDIAPANPGDVFTTYLQDGSSRYVEVALLESALDFPDIDCGISLVGGNDGHTLSCVAESTAWLYYSITQLGGPNMTELSPQRRDLSSATHQFAYHDQWKPRGNCSTPYCMMSSTAPLNTWVEVGNGTSGGVFHDLHFANFGNMSGHRVYRRGFDNSTWTRSSRSSKRQYTYQTAHWRADYYQYRYHQGAMQLNPVGSQAWKDWYGIQDPDTELQVSDSIGSAVEDVVAMTNFHNLCVGMGIEGNISDYGYMEFGYPGLAEPTFETVEANLNDCDNYLASGNPSSTSLVCFYDLGRNDSTLMEPDPPYKLKLKFKREYLEPLSVRELEYLARLDRRAGPDSGQAKDYPFYQYPENQNGPTPYFNFRTATYPNGNNGAALDAETGRNERYALLDPADCEETAITPNGVQGQNWDNVDTEHPEDRSNFPYNFGPFAQSGQLDMFDGTTFQSQLPVFSFDSLLNNFAADYRTWVPATVEPNPPAGSASGDIADALGSSSNPRPLYNLERWLNVLKGRIYTMGGQPTEDSIWNTWMQIPGQGSAEAALTSLRGVFAVFNNMRAIQPFRDMVFEDRRAAAQQFDDLYGRTYPTRPERLAPLIDEFQTHWETRVTNWLTDYVTRRLDDLDSVYMPMTAAGHPQMVTARLVVTAVARMRARIPNELHF